MLPGTRFAGVGAAGGRAAHDGAALRRDRVRPPDRPRQGCQSGWMPRFRRQGWRNPRQGCRGTDAMDGLSLSMIVAMYLKIANDIILTSSSCVYIYMV